MRNSTDPRIPIVMGGEPGPEDAVLVEAGWPAPAQSEVFTLATHAAGCLCCAGRSGAAEALARLFRARATGSAPFFSRVVVLASPAGQAAVARALGEDVLAQARYRYAEAQ
jgi:G3E family GTPase